MGDTTPSSARSNDPFDDNDTPRGQSREPPASNATSTPPRPQQAFRYDSHSNDSIPPNTTRSRAASRPPPPIPQQPQPIKDAVNTAFDQSPTSSQLDPDFMKRLTEQVTEQVIKNLQAANIATGTSPPLSVPSRQSQQTSSSSQYASWSPSQRSPLISSTDSFPPRFTPPSPRKDWNQRDASPERAPSDAGSNYSRESRESQRSRTSTQSNKESSTPRASQPDVPEGLKRSKTTAADGTNPLSKDAQARRRESGHDAKAFRKDSKDSDSTFFDGSPRNRAQPTSVAEEPAEATTLEKIWQPLFDNGNPTVRLGQFLRGLARHIIEDYEPKGSLVITPAKMLQFLDETKVPDESYPWSTIFGGKMNPNSISMMYRKLLCQHHFVQHQVHEAPLIPALTPLGFEAFMTCLVQAHPDSEFERLAKAVKEMPISNADDIRERFPKELSRRLLPDTPNVRAEQRIISSLNHEPVLVPLARGASAMPPPPASAPPHRTSFSERERTPYSQTSLNSNAVTDEDLTPPSIPLERERKPYFAKEGTGKRYENEGDRDRDREREKEWEQERDSREPSRPPTNKYRPERPEYPGSRPSRQNSGMPQQATFSTNKGGAPEGPPPNRARKSSGPGPVPPAPNYPKGSRRSPPPRGFAYSEPNDVGNIPQSQYASNLHSGQFSQRFAGDYEADPTRYSNRRPNDRNTNYMNDDDPNGRPIPPRSGPAGPPGYEYGPAGGTPSNQSASRTGDDRRRSWYPGMAPNMPSTAGTDGYGSHAPNPTMYGSSGQF